MFTIRNDRKTTETFDKKEIEMRNCKVLVIVRSTNHQLTDIPNNVIFQQVEGKTAIISRVESGMILAQIASLSTLGF